MFHTPSLADSKALQRPEPAPKPWLARRAVVLVAFLAIAALILAVRPLHSWLLEQFSVAETIIRQNGAWSMALFVALAALSAMIAFVSSSVLIPVAIYAWGPWACAALLWAGWFLGGVAAYAIGRLFGRRLVGRLIGAEAVERQERWARSPQSLAAIVLFQLAVPTDLAGYIFGVIRTPVLPFLLALGVAEIPYAIGSVFLGVSFVERRPGLLVLLGLAGALLSIAALHAHHRTHLPSKTQRRQVSDQAEPQDG